MTNPPDSNIEQTGGCGCIQFLAILLIVVVGFLGYQLGLHWGMAWAVVGTLVGMILGVPATGVLLFGLMGVAYVIERFSGG